jgi:peptidoglycan pentaglycine glycine transferase (the first glycine)
VTDWDQKLLALADPPSLLQSWGYGEAQRQEGWSVERLVLGGARAQVLLQGVGPMRRAYVPRGPVPATPEAVDELVEWARRQRLARLRLEPEAPDSMRQALRDRGFVPASGLQPVDTLIVPLGAEEEMLGSFKPKHRYNIRKALRSGVQVEEGCDVAELHRQHARTAGRQGLSAPSLDAYRRRLELLEWCRVYVAEVEGEPVAAIMVARFGGRAYYLFGGSSDRHRQLMPAYAAQWAAMRAAATAGCREYDLWGVPPTADDPGHPWHGLWQFKAGFGGQLVRYCGGWDLVLSPLRARLGRTTERMGRIARLVKAR